MAVTKQTYEATASWTAVSLSNIFRSAFIDAGLMTDWFDSSANGDIRVMRIIYDGTKAYGTTYYIFYFLNLSAGFPSNGGVYLNIATGWNTTTKTPTGTQYLDFVPAGYFALFEVGYPAPDTTFILDRYTTTASPAQSWFVIRRSPTIFRAFTIDGSTRSPQPWLDLNKGVYSGFYHVSGSQSSGGYGAITFKRGPGIRREITAGGGLTGSTNAAHYVQTFPTLDVLVYAGIGNSAGNTGNYISGIHLPIGFSSSNPAYTQDSNPVFFGMPYSPYSLLPLSPDFGISFHYATNAFLQGDVLVVQAGVEEWEILAYVANGSSLTGASALFLGRII